MIENLKEQGDDDIIVLVGGVVSEPDRIVLKEMGATEVFASGADVAEIVKVINEHVAKDSAQRSRRISHGMEYRVYHEQKGDLHARKDSHNL